MTKHTSQWSGRSLIDEPGSAYLQTALQTYWALRLDGESAPKFARSFVAGDPHGNSRRFDVRSDMVDGTPRGWAWRWDEKRQKWGLVKDERTGAKQIPPRLVGQDVAGAATSAHSEVHSGARDSRKSTQREAGRVLRGEL